MTDKPKLRLIRFRGEDVPLSVLAKVFMKAWEEREALHLKALIFRIPIVYKYNEDKSFAWEFDLNLSLTNEMVYRILKMPKVGIRKGYVEAIFERDEACFDGNELVSFEPCEQDIVEWAQERGFYLEFDELEIQDEACLAAG